MKTFASLVFSDSSSVSGFVSRIENIFFRTIFVKLLMENHLKCNVWLTNYCLAVEQTDFTAAQETYSIEKVKSC
jgi:hypothetical protein